MNKNFDPDLLPNEKAKVSLGMKFGYGSCDFALNLGSAIAGFLAGWGLNIAGYVANAEQSAGSLMGIRILITFVPLIFIILGMILISFFPIDEKMHRQIVAQISKRGT